MKIHKTVYILFYLIAEHNPLVKELAKKRVNEIEPKFKPSIAVVGMAHS